MGGIRWLKGCEVTGLARSQPPGRYPQTNGTALYEVPEARIVSHAVRSDHIVLRKIELHAHVIGTAAVAKVEAVFGSQGFAEDRLVSDSRHKLDPRESLN